MIDALPGGLERQQDIRKAAEEFATRIGSDVVNEFEGVGIVGNPAEELIKFTESKAIGMIVVGDRNRSPVVKILFGSVTQSLILSGIKPVMNVLQ